MNMKKTARIVALLLLCLAASLFATDNAALIKAAEKGDFATVRSLINAGANVNAQGADGWTALMRAARGGHAACGRLLIEAGADVNVQNGIGRTALSLAEQMGHTETANVLRKDGAR